MARAVALLAERHRKQQQILCLPPATGELPETGGVIVASHARPTRKPIEHAGHIYQQKVIRAYSVNPPPPTDDDDNDNDNDDETNDNRGGLSDSTSTTTTDKATSAAQAASTLASKLAVGSDDLYELLELGDKRWHATADDIKKSFRRLSLTYHPDKIAHLGEDAREKSEAHFKAVMKAYDILSDKKKRAAYDSIDDVDDSIPSEKDATTSTQRFYEKFGACFALNARWSISDRVPSLGDDDTDLDSVNKFYDFWYSFKSWRDFSFDLEYNTDQAECREEKRWMERQNAKHVKSKKLEENARIRRLVDLAYKHDPRLQRERAAVKAKKDAQKLEKRKAAEERARIERERIEKEKEEAERKAAEEKERRAVAKKQKENARQVMRKTRQKLRAVARSLNLVALEKGNFNIEKMCMEGTLESIDAIATLLSTLDTKNKQQAMEKGLQLIDRAVQNPREIIVVAESNKDDTTAHNDVNENGEDSTNVDTDSSSTTVHTSLRDHENENGNTSITAASSSSPSVEANGVASPESKKTNKNSTISGNSKNNPTWTADELSALSKGVAKFPGGTRDRWQRLADYIGTKSADEVLRKVNELRASKAASASAALQNAKSGLATKKEEARAFERFQEKKKGAKAPFTGSTTTTTSTSTTTTSATLTSKSKTSSSSSSSSSSSTTAKSKTRTKTNNPNPSAPHPTTAKSGQKLANGNTGNNAGVSSSASSSQPPNKLFFTPREQATFESALKKFTAAEGDMRWKKVSNIVGRSPNECQQRFNELIAFFQAKKAKQ